MIKVFIDTNVILDYLLDRSPYSMDAAKILTLAGKGKIRAFISTLTIANCYYLMRKFSSNEKVIRDLERLCDFVGLLDLKKSSTFAAFKFGFNDFEDALQNETVSSESNLDTIITRNVRDFKKSTMDIMTPETFLKIFGHNQPTTKR